MDNGVFIIRDDGVVYVITQADPQDLPTVVKLGSWVANILDIRDGVEVFLIGLTNIGQTARYRLPASTPVFDMRSFGHEGYTIRRAVNLPDMQLQS